MPIGCAIVEILRLSAATAFMLFLRALWLEHVQDLAKDENTQKQWQREHSANEQVSGAWGSADRKYTKSSSRWLILTEKEIF